MTNPKCTMQSMSAQLWEKALQQGCAHSSKLGMLICLLASQSNVIAALQQHICWPVHHSLAH